jgi:tetratricopeptide (TPR) repeat protein
VPRDVFLHLRSLSSLGQFSEALRVLNQGCSLNSRDEDAVAILSNLGRIALEEREYELAYQAYLTAYDHARKAPRLGPVFVLGVLCDAVELSTLAVDQSKSVDTTPQRAALERALTHATVVPEQPISPDLLSKLIIAAGEVGSTQRMHDTIEEYCNGRDAGHLNSAATEGLLELLLGHEYVMCVRVQGLRLLEDAQEAYLNAYRRLKPFPEYAPLKSYALLCAARVASTMQDRAGIELYLDESAHEFIELPPQNRSTILAAILLDELSKAAELQPHRRAVFDQVFDAADLPVHHLISGLVRWTSPYCVDSRLKQTENPTQYDEVLEDVRRLLKRAQLLVADVMGVSNLDRAQLSISTCHMHLRGGDVEKAIRELREGLGIAAVDPRGIDIVFPSLTNFAWEQDRIEYASELCSMYSELIQIAPQSRTNDEDVADFKFQLVVGLVNALVHAECSNEKRAEILTGALKNLIVYLLRKQASPSSEIYSFAQVLQRGAELACELSPCLERSELLSILRDLHAESLRRRDRMEGADFEWLQRALEVEQSAVVLYEMLGDSARLTASNERIGRINQEIDFRISEDEARGYSDGDDSPSEWS